VTAPVGATTSESTNGQAAGAYSRFDLTAKGGSRTSGKVDLVRFLEEQILPNLTA
jgi:hypothetical protein